MRDYLSGLRFFKQLDRAYACAERGELTNLGWWYHVRERAAAAARARGRGSINALKLPTMLGALIASVLKYPRMEVDGAPHGWGALQKAWHAIRTHALIRKAVKEQQPFQQHTLNYLVVNLALELAPSRPTWLPSDYKPVFFNTNRRFIARPSMRTFGMVGGRTSLFSYAEGNTQAQIGHAVSGREHVIAVSRTLFAKSFMALCKKAPEALAAIEGDEEEGKRLRNRTVEELTLEHWYQRTSKPSDGAVRGAIGGEGCISPMDLNGGAVSMNQVDWMTITPEDIRFPGATLTCRKPMPATAEKGPTKGASVSSGSPQWGVHARC
jgi:hypothetical protein